MIELSARTGSQSRPAFVWVDVIVRVGPLTAAAFAQPLSKAIYARLPCPKLAKMTSSNSPMAVDDSTSSLETVGAKLATAAEALVAELGKLRKQLAGPKHNNSNGTNNANTNIDDEVLPVFSLEVFGLIGDFLEPKSRKTLRNLAMGNKALWDFLQSRLLRRLDVSIISQTPSFQLFRSKNPFALKKHVKELTHVGQEWNPDHSQLNANMKEHQDALLELVSPNLERLSIGYWPQDFVVFRRMVFPKLKWLEIQVLRELPRWLPRLFPELEFLSLVGVSEITVNAFPSTDFWTAVQESWPKLKEIRLSRFSDFARYREIPRLIRLVKHVEVWRWEGLAQLLEIREFAPEHLIINTFPEDFELERSRVRLVALPSLKRIKVNCVHSRTLATFGFPPNLESFHGDDIHPSCLSADELDSLRAKFPPTLRDVVMDFSMSFRTAEPFYQPFDDHQRDYSERACVLGFQVQAGTLFDARLFSGV